MAKPHVEIVHPFTACARHWVIWSELAQHPIPLALLSHLEYDTMKTLGETAEPPTMQQRS
jgi:hypothetical protein